MSHTYKISQNFARKIIDFVQERMQTKVRVALVCVQSFAQHSLRSRYDLTVTLFPLPQKNRNQLTHTRPQSKKKNPPVKEMREAPSPIPNVWPDRVLCAFTAKKLRSGEDNFAAPTFSPLSDRRVCSADVADAIPKAVLTSNFAATEFKDSPIDRQECSGRTLRVRPMFRPLRQAPSFFLRRLLLFGEALLLLWLAAA